MEILFLLLILPFLLFLIGYFGAKLHNYLPPAILKINEITALWFEKNDWYARIKVLFLPLLFFYNFFVWSIYGLYLILEFIFNIVKFIYKDVLKPTIFWIIRLFIHYIFKMGFYLFQFSLSYVVPSFKKTSINIALKRLFYLGLVSAFCTFCYILYPHTLVLVISIIIIVSFSIYTQFKITQFHKKEFTSNKLLESLKFILIWLGIVILSSFIIFQLNDIDLNFVSAIGFSFELILIPLIYLLIMTIEFSSIYLPRYFCAKEKIDTFDFVKQIALRLPTFIYAQLFKIIGIVVVGIIPLIIVLLINSSLFAFTHKNIKFWYEEIYSSYNTIPIYFSNTEEIKKNEDSITVLTINQKDYQSENSENIEALEKELTQYKLLKNMIKPNKIHSLTRNHYVGEKQHFSLPYSLGCNSYLFKIDKEGKNIYREPTVNTSTQSLKFEYTWKEPGQYTISIAPDKSCGLSIDTFYVTVLPEDPELTNKKDSYFKTIEEADELINQVNNNIHLLNQDLITYNENYQNNLKELKQDNKNLAQEIEEMFLKIPGNLLALIGFVIIFSILFSTILTFINLFNFNLYDFRQDGEHYIVKTYLDFKKSNPNQPLLGFFILFFVASILSFFIIYLPFNNLYSIIKIYYLLN